MIHVTFNVTFEDGVRKEVIGELHPEIVKVISSWKEIKALPNRKVVASLLAMSMAYQDQMNACKL